MTLNNKWALAELDAFIDSCRAHRTAYDRGGEHAFRDPKILTLHDDVTIRMPIIEQICDRAWPVWKAHLPTVGYRGWKSDPLVQIAKQTRVMLERQDELEQNLGEAGPKLSESTMHADVWDAAKSLWRSGHFRDAVLAAARSVNAALQTKVNRRDTGEFDLVTQSFTLDPPKPGQPRLRLVVDDGGDTYKSRHRGAMFFGQGCFTAIRNVLAHEHGQAAEIPEDLAHHYLATFSVLAQWIDEATVVR